jgi:hypothetical protein
MAALNLLVAGVLAIYVLSRVTRWMHRRGWIQWNMRGTSSALGNAMLGVQVIYQPQVREVLEQRLEEPDEAGEQGDPPSPGGTEPASARQAHLRPDKQGP